ncbi:uncharacterized protein LOC141632549 [Silene latifolia]|uniref:uncharacterized protein LOC141632549 n=1 Tax=Silene latifolia TaxID=37657 RepID=UPI003D778495
MRYLYDPSPPQPGIRANDDVRSSYEEYQRESYAVKNVLIFAISQSFKRKCIHLTAHEIYTRHTAMFSRAPRKLQYDDDVHFFEASLNKGQSVSSHVLKMIEYVEILEKHGCQISQEIVIDRVLHSLHEGFAQFRVNYIMNNVNKIIQEVHGHLIQAERDMQACWSVKKDVLTGLRNVRQLAKGEVDLRVGNGARVAAIYKGTYMQKVSLL